MKITISGHVGSGKSTVGNILARKLGYRRYSIGDIMREIAKTRDVSIMELSKVAEKDPSIDKELDRRQIEIGKKEDNFIMDSRLGFHFVPDSFKIFLTVNIKEAAKRIFREKRHEEDYKDEKEAADFLKKRMRSEKKRYKDIYGIDFPDKRYFDLVLDTTKRKPEEIAGEIIRRIRS